MGKTVLILWSVLSFFVSGIFIFQGLLMLQAKTLPVNMLISALVALSYGIISIFLQSQNWKNPSPKYVTFTTYLVVLMFLNQLFFSSGAGMGKAAGLLGLSIIALMLATNWLAIKYVAKHKK